MTYNLNDYRHVIKPIVQTWIENKGFDDKTVSMLAISTDCPAVVVAHFVGEVNGFNNAILKQINKLETFYKVDQVLGSIGK